MEIKNKLAALTILTAFNFANVQAATIDTELAVIAAEQANDDSQEKKSEAPATANQEKKSRKELRAEEKRLKEERKAAERQHKEEMKAAEKEVREAQKNSKDKKYQQLKNSERDSSKKNFPTVDPVTTPVESVPVEKPEPAEEVTTFEPPATSTPVTTQPPAQSQTPPPVQPSTPVTTQPPAQSQTPPPATSTPVTTQTPEQTQTPAVSLPNAVTMQANFDDLAKAANFVPLYMPKKSGFTINSMMLIGGRTAEIRYGRRWEPEVSLNIRTYKRFDGEETKDISGVSGVKWRVDMTSGTTVYIAKIAENKHVAAWAVGNYTFSAQAENLSFAAFHAIVADELVDLSRHYYVN